MFNDNSRYLADILTCTIDNPESEKKHISDAYPAELQLNKSNSCAKEIPLDLDISGSR